MELFYTPIDPEEILELPDEESRHLVKVMRLVPGDEIFLTNGRGNLYRAKIVNTNDRKCIVRIVETKTESGKRAGRLHVGIAPTKNTERFEWFLEKATEIGIDSITPVICRRSERRTMKDERLHKIIIAAMKQSMRTYLPALNPACDLNDFIQQPLPGRKFICSQESLSTFQSLCPRGEDAVVLVGPEGDFHPDETQLALQSGFQTASLGKSRLRTETAGLLVCADFAFINS